MSWDLLSRGPLLSRVFVRALDSQRSLLTPLYVPSFSSFGDRDFGARALATLKSLSFGSSPDIKPPVLLSAYDLKRRLGIGQKTALTYLKDLLEELAKYGEWYLDSGIFERDCFFDESWTLEEFTSVSNLANPPSVVAFDFKPASASFVGFKDALERTLELAKNQHRASHVTLLVRFHEGAGLWETDRSQEEGTRIVTFLECIVSNLKCAGDQIDVVGVAEVELGPGIRSRLRSLARLRTALDHDDIQKPIHVFGASDPQSLALYTLAGADIFDGVSWSRFYLDAEDYCVRDKGLMSWKEPALGESTSVGEQNELLGVANILRMHQFTSTLRRLIESRRPETAREESWIHFVENCFEGILAERD